MCNISTCTQLVIYKTEDGWHEKSEFCTFQIISSYYEAYYVHFVAGKRLWQDKIFFECFFLMNIKYNHLIYVLLPFIAQWPESATRRMHNHCIITTILTTIKKRKSLKAMCNISKCTQFNIRYKTEDGLRLKNGGNEKDIFPLYVDNKGFQSYSLIRNFRSTIILGKNISSYYVKTLLLDAGFGMPHSHWETARFWILQMWGNWQSVFFSLLKKPLVYQFHWSCTLLHTLKKKKMNLLISLQLVIRKLTVYSGNCFPKLCFEDHRTR